MTKPVQKITPNLWFDRQAEEAANLYASIFKNSRVGDIVRAGKAGFEIHGLPEGTVMTVAFEIEGCRFVAINGGPLFKFTPAISFLVACRTKEEVEALWEKLVGGRFGAHGARQRTPSAKDTGGSRTGMGFPGR